MIQKIRDWFLGSSEFDNFDVSYRVALGNYYEKPIYIQSVNTVEGRKWIIAMQLWLLSSDGCWHPTNRNKSNDYRTSCFDHFNSKEEALSTLTNSLEDLKHTLYQDKPSEILCLIA